MGGLTVVATARREIAERDPRGSAMADRGELFERRVGGTELRLRVVEPALLEERAAEDELGVADLVEEVDAAVEQCSAWRDCSSACSR